MLTAVSEQPAMVFGSSSGAIVALAAFTRHPDLIRLVVPHEPPAMKLLPDGEEWLDVFREVHDLYRQSGVEAALKMFRDRAFAPIDQRAMAHAPASAYAQANAVYWFEHELRQYPATNLDLATLTARPQSVLPTAGRESRGCPTYAVTVALAERLGRVLTELPGGHVGFLTNCAPFAQELINALTSASAA